MINQFSRTELLFGPEGMKKLKNARVAVFGIGGVGGHAVEALVRSGIGTLDLIDNDKVSLTNLNRQIIATQKTIDCYKVDVMKQRILEINPDACVNIRQCFFLPENAHTFDFKQYSYVIDAVDTVAAKLELAVRSKEAGVPLISSMGAGNKMKPEAFEVSDIYQTSVCPLAKVMRRELKKRGIQSLKVVYSREEPVSISPEEAVKYREECETAGDTAGLSKRTIPGSNAFVPAVAGLILAGEVVKDLTGV